MKKIFNISLLLLTTLLLSTSIIQIMQIERIRNEEKANYEKTLSEIKTLVSEQMDEQKETLKNLNTEIKMQTKYLKATAEIALLQAHQQLANTIAMNQANPDIKAYYYAAVEAKNKEKTLDKIFEEINARPFSTIIFNPQWK